MQACRLSDGYGPALEISSSALIACCRILLSKGGDSSHTATGHTELAERLGTVGAPLNPRKR